MSSKRVAFVRFARGAVAIVLFSISCSICFVVIPAFLAVTLANIITPPARCCCPPLPGSGAGSSAPPRSGPEPVSVLSPSWGTSRELPVATLDGAAENAWLRLREHAGLVAAVAARGIEDDLDEVVATLCACVVAAEIERGSALGRQWASQAPGALRACHGLESEDGTLATCVRLVAAEMRGGA